MVEVTGFEPATSRPPDERATRLRYTSLQAHWAFSIITQNRLKLGGNGEIQFGPFPYRMRGFPAIEAGGLAFSHPAARA